MIGDIIYLIMILLGALIGLAYFKICTLSFKFLSILLAYTFISESIATYMRHINKNPTFLMALYTPIHVIFITLIYYNLLKISKSKFAIAFIGIGFFSFAILKKVSHGPIIITTFSTIEFGLRGQLGGFY